jgi:hypothetical protein
VKVQSRFIVLSIDFQKDSLAANSDRTSAPADGAVPPIGVNGDVGTLPSKARSDSQGASDATSSQMKHELMREASLYKSAQRN